MNKYFKAKTSYLKKESASVEGEKERKISEIRLFQAEDYMDTQAKATEICQKLSNSSVDIDFEIQKVNYENILFKNNDEKDSTDNFWYEVKVSEISESESGEEKIINKRYLAEGEDLEDALDTTRKYYTEELNISEDTWYFSGVQETLIEQVILQQ